MPDEEMTIAELTEAIDEANAYIAEFEEHKSNLHATRVAARQAMLNLEEELQPLRTARMVLEAARAKRVSVDDEEESATVEGASASAGAGATPPAS